MGKIYVDFDEEIPRYACTSCFNCTSIMGESHCKIKNRGCCWYFPKFTLFEIQRMSKTLEGLQTLNTIIKTPSSTIYQYYIHTKGYFDSEGYSKYIHEEFHFRENLPKDSTIFFRACPFVIDSKGCTLPPKYRTHICNFFICDEIIKEAESNDIYKKYIKERASYSRFVDWENSSLKRVLIENNTNLISNFEKTIKLLQSIPITEYEFPHLEPIEYIDSAYKGA